ncbi:MAG: cold shock protein [Actinomycetia bacterium]|nr:cold shock protein [Actinomycetes bacterium]
MVARVGISLARPMHKAPVDGPNLCIRHTVRRGRKRKSSYVPTGIVKFFDAQKGYGFISREGEPDVFVHYSNITGAGYKSLEQGQQVEFEIGPGRKGDEAQNVRVI